MKVSSSNLDSLFSLHGVETKLRKLRIELKELATGKHLEIQREEILQLNQELTAQRTKVEDLERETTRVAHDLELVEQRISKDSQLLTSSSNAKDIQGIQHEMQTLARRKDELETAELELMEQLDTEQERLAQLIERKRVLEAELEDAKSATQEQIKLSEADILSLQQDAGRLRASCPAELVAIYDLRAARGVPIGRLLQSTCGACNMSLTSTSMNELHKVPSDELARCPECSAILVRA